MSIPFLHLIIAVSLYASAPAVAADEARLLERGTYLVEGIGACGNCHFPRDESGRPLRELGFSGGMRFDEPHFGVAYAANITPDIDSGIGRWSDEEIGIAIREGRRPDGSFVGPPMPVEFYREMSDEDLAAIVSYVRSQPAVANIVPEPNYAFTRTPEPISPVRGIATPPEDDPVRYGEYLVALGHCMECHTPRDESTGQLRDDAFGAGGRVFNGPWGESLTRNLTSHESGLRDWSDAQIATAVRAGIDREGSPYKPPMAFAFYAAIDDEDMAAVIAYLRTLDPIPLGGPG